MKPESQPAVLHAVSVDQSALLFDLARCIILMEHVNRVAERQLKLGDWLSDHTKSMAELDDEYRQIRKRLP